MEVNVNKVYDLYELFNDFNRITILIHLCDNELPIKEISRVTGIALTSVTHQIEYLKNSGVIKENNGLYKINDKSLKRIISSIKDYAK